jgi:GTPase
MVCKRVTKFYAMFKSGFVNIIGRPNVGKSTLINTLLGEKMSIITHKPQTTRHRILGILNEPEYQIVFSDTPGIIENPSYKMQSEMNRFAHSTFEDSDVMLFVTSSTEKYDAEDVLITRLQNLAKGDTPLILVLNKCDLLTHAQQTQYMVEWGQRVNFTHKIGISALKEVNTKALLTLILDQMKEGPKYYPDDQLTDRSERFFATEIIREKILLLYHEEIPYSCEVAIESFKETTTKDGRALTRISGVIFVARKTQKAIVIGKDGSAIKKLGTDARKSLEEFLQCAVFLELHVKIRENWRDDEQVLRQFGYKE